MFEAQFMMALPDPGLIVYSPWFPRRGDYLLATIDVAAISGVTLDVEVATKNNEDVGDGSIVAGSISVGSTGRSSNTWGPSVLKDLVRYRFSCFETLGGIEWIGFRMLSPVWFDSVKG